MSLATGWRAQLLVAGAVLVASATSLRNGFAYDDDPIIRDNPRVHAIASPATLVRESYWPSGIGGGLWRPGTIFGFELQWALGRGRPLVFHLGSLLLTIGGALGVLALLGTLVAPLPALLGALLYAVHPVHSEAVANVVGQAELHVALATAWAAVLYLRARRHAGPVPIGASLAMALLSLWACLCKEQGVLLPAMLGLLELTVVDDATPWRERVRRLVPTFGLLGASVLLAVVARQQVLEGDLAGPVAWPLRGLDAGARLRAMLAIVPTWFRLLLWPMHLRAEYNPPSFGLVPATPWPSLVGVSLLAALACVALVLRRRAPAVTLGIAWLALALLPVSNVLVPTGIVVAERTMLLPSVGVCVAVAGGAAALPGRIAPGRIGGLALAVLATVLLGAFAWRSATRMPVWRSTGTLFSAMVVDDPASYKAHFHHGEYLAAYGDTTMALREMRTAWELWRGDARMLEEYGQLLRARGRCDEAVPVLQRALALDGDRIKARNRLYFCFLRLGRYPEARAVAETGLAQGDSLFIPYIRRADSLAALAR